MVAWYAVQTRARHESEAATHLARQDFETYLPRLRLFRRRRGRWHPVVEALFPGYLFLRLDLERQNTAPIRSTRGVVGLVRFGGVPKPVPEDLIRQLQAASRDAEGVIRQEPHFQPGDRVEIVSGPLAGLPAIFQSSNGEERVRLLLDLLGRRNEVLVSRHHLVPFPERE